jgi:hypothetical protein
MRQIKIECGIERVKLELCVPEGTRKKKETHACQDSRKKNMRRFFS